MRLELLRPAVVVGELVDEAHDLLVEAVPLVHHRAALAVVVQQIPVRVADLPVRVEQSQMFLRGPAELGVAPVARAPLETKPAAYRPA